MFQRVPKSFWNTLSPYLFLGYWKRKADKHRKVSNNFKGEVFFLLACVLNRKLSINKTLENVDFCISSLLVVIVNKQQICDASKRYVAYRVGWRPAKQEQNNYVVNSHCNHSLLAQLACKIAWVDEMTMLYDLWIHFVSNFP